MYTPVLPREPIPFEAVAAAGHQPCWMPRVQVAGPAPLAGQAVEVRQGGARAGHPAGWDRTMTAPLLNSPGLIPLPTERRRNHRPSDGRSLATFDLPGVASSGLTVIQQVPRRLEASRRSASCLRRTATPSPARRRKWKCTAPMAAGLPASVEL